MSGYVKLFSSILHSTIWRESDHTRLVFITMLAMADKDGRVEASVPGLADAARVPLAGCQTALASLQAPDPFSRTVDSEGRRIEVMDGGWRLLNHAKYRAKLGAEERRDYNALKKREQRAREKSTTVNDSQQSQHKAKADTRSRSRSKKSTSALDKGGVEFCAFWTAYPRKVGKAAALKAWVKHSCWKYADDIMNAVAVQAEQPQWHEQDGRFIPHAASWLNGGRWNDETHIQAAHAGILGPPSDWWVQCKELHRGRCNGRFAHSIQLDIDKEKRHGAL